MSEMGSFRRPESRLHRLSLQRNGNGREDDNNSPVLTVVQGMPMFVLGVVVTLILSSYVTKQEGWQAFSTNPSADNFTPVDRFAFSLLGLFSFYLASITFGPKLPSIASFFEDITVIFFASTFASLVCIVTPLRRHWVVYSVCMVPLLPLNRGPCMLLLRCFNWILNKTQHKSSL